MTAKPFETALGSSDPRHLGPFRFDEKAKALKPLFDFKIGSRFAIPGHAGVHPVPDRLSKTDRRLNFCQHECHLQAHMPRVKLPGGSVRLVAPALAGWLSGFALLFQALMRMLAGLMPFAAVVRIVGQSPQRVPAVGRTYLESACGLADHPAVTPLAIDETSRARADNAVASAADSDQQIACAGSCKAHLRERLQRKQVSVVRAMLARWCVMRSKVGPVRHVARMIRKLRQGILGWAQTCQTNGFLEAGDELVQASGCRASGFPRLFTIRTVIFLIPRTLDFQAINPHAGQPT